MAVKINIYNIARIYTGTNAEDKKQWGAQLQLVYLTTTPILKGSEKTMKEESEKL